MKAIASRYVIWGSYYSKQQQLEAIVLTDIIERSDGGSRHLWSG